LDLERTVALAQEQGIQATIHMQLAAQRVAHENAKLRSLLEEVGVCDKTIEAWLSKNASSNDSDHCRPLLKAQVGKTAQELIPAHHPNAEEPRKKSSNVDRASSLLGPCTGGQDLYPQGPSSIPAESSTSNGEASPKQICASSCKENSSVFQIRKPATAPCRLLTSLGDNATVDTMQFPPPLRPVDQPDDGDELGANSGNGVA
jgi:hypothetical protein